MFEQISMKMMIERRIEQMGCGSDDSIDSIDGIRDEERTKGEFP